MGPQNDAGALSRRQVLAGGAVLAAGSVLVACGGGKDSGGGNSNAAASPAETPSTGEPKRGGTLRYAVGDGLAKDSLDPALTGSAMITVGGFAIYDTLVRVDNDWNVAPMLAEDHSVNGDATEYSFKLRKGVEFHDGSPFTADDVAAHFKRVLDEKTGSPGLSLLGSLLKPSGIVVGDPTTITFKLDRPDAFFAVRMAHVTARIPKAGAPSWIKGSYGTGPFKNIEFKPGEGFHFERNENYWAEGEPYLDAIDGINIPEQATKAQAVLTGDVDLCDRTDASVIPQFEASETAALFDLGSPTPFMVDIDSSIEPFSDPDVRRALKMLVDRQKMLDLVWRGQGIISPDSLISPEDPFFPAGFEPPPFDPEQAKALLAKAGYADGFPAKIWTTTAYPYLNPGAQVIESGWAQAGIKAEIASVSSDRYDSAFLSEPILMDFAPRQHPSFMFDLFMSPASDLNVSRVEDPKLERLIKEFSSTLDEARQKEISGEVIRLYDEVAAELIPVHFSELWPYKKRVVGLEANPMCRIDLRKAGFAA